MVQAEGFHCENRPLSCVKAAEPAEAQVKEEKADLRANQQNSQIDPPLDGNGKPFQIFYEFTCCIFGHFMHGFPTFLGDVHHMRSSRTN